MMRCVINILFRWNPMKLVTYYLEEVIKGMKHLCVFWKPYDEWPSNKKPTGNVPGECGVLLSLASFSSQLTEVPLLGALKMCEIFDKSVEQMLILPPSSSSTTWVHMCPDSSKKLRAALIFQITVWRSINCDVLTADPSCWSDQSWEAWVGAW